MVPFPEQENQLYDLKTRLLARTYFQRPESVVVVEISKEDFEVLRRRFGKSQEPSALGPWREKFDALRNQFFWDDGVYETLLQRILDSDPKRVLVTFFYSESLVLLQGNPKLQQLARQPAVLWASQFDLDQKLLKPAPELTGIENYGFTNLHQDIDGVVRRAYLLQKNHMSLPFRALVDGPDSLKTSMPLNDPFFIRFRGGPGYIPTCQVLDLFDPDNDKNNCGSLRDKFVILSPTGNIVAGASLYRTPVGPMSRGEVLANILLTAQSANPVLTLSSYLLFFAVLGHCLGLARIVLQSGGRRQLRIALFFLLGEAFVSLLLLRFFSLHVPLIPFVIGTVFSYLAFLWLKFALQESKRWQAEKKNQYLRELDELKSNFLSLMSHDLKTPIAKVQALTERLTREARTLTDDQKEILSSIQKSNEELGEYILSILNFQRIESQEMKLNKKSHDINLLIEEVTQRLAPLSQEKGITVNLELEPMFALALDEQLIKQVLNNLIDNAIKYNKAGTVVTVRSQDLEDYIEVTVADDGVGIDSQQMDRLFKKFSRAEKGTSERVKGTGLGLYLAKYFIELHGGDIQVESEIGKGTTFRFRMPVAD